VYRRLFIIIYISLCSGLLLKSQDVKQTFELAESLFAIGQYDAALKHYHRVAFFAGDSMHEIVFPRIAECYFQTNDFRKSILYYELATNTTANDSLLNEYLFSRVLCYYILEEYDYALQQLYAFKEGDYPHLSSRFHFYHAAISMKRADPDKALDHFVLMVDDPDVADEIREIFAKARLQHPKPTLAKILSLIIPGLGQAYSGDFKNAANSFMLNGLLAGLTYSIAIKYSLLDAGLSTFSWLHRYYMGGFTRAEIIAVNRRIEKREKLLDKTLEIIEQHKFSQ
jgi:tetratricopeptide (TPR) repeat protein